MPRRHASRVGLIASFLLTGAAAGQPELLWVEQFGSQGEDSIWGLATDEAGGVFLAGSTEGSLGAPNAGGSDGMLARYDSEGNELWIAQFGTQYDDPANAAAPDGARGAFVAGYTWLDLGGPNAGSTDVYLARYDGAGTGLWMTQFGSKQGESATALRQDGLGGVLVAGATLGNLGGPTHGQSDVFLARYDADGAQTWIAQFGSGGLDNATDLVSDGAGGVFLAGFTTGDLDGVNLGKEDAFLARLDGSGNLMWITQFGTDARDEANGLAPDGAGGVFITGFTKGSLGAPNIGGFDSFVARYDADGGRTWINQFGTTGTDATYAAMPDGGSGVILTGFTSGSLGGPTAGQTDCFLVRYDSAGNQTWATQFGSQGEDEGLALAPDGAGGVIVAGETSGHLGGPGKGNFDAFLARLHSGCYADCDGSQILDLFDFLCFVNMFNMGGLDADCDGNESLDLFDFLCFVNAFNDGC